MIAEKRLSGQSSEGVETVTTYKSLSRVIEPLLISF